MADPKTPKLRSPFFRVAVEGATSDGRQIERAWIEQAAASYNPKTYGARIWMEHIRSSVADSPFKAYGDVVAVKAEEVEINGQKKLALFAQIEPTADLVALNKAKQKIYTSIEISPKFADTGAAYLVGLGITDSPASLGTDVLSFAAANPAGNPYAGRKQHADNLFTVAEETALTFAEVEDKPILGNAYRIGHNLVPWHHHEERDLRTLLDLYPAAKLRDFEGIRHHALHDARHEAHQLIQALSVHALRLDCAKAEAGRVASLEHSYAQPNGLEEK